MQDVGFWYGLCNTSNSESPKISKPIFQLCSNLSYAYVYELLWLMEVHSLLDSLGISIFFIVQELCESRGGRPGLSVLTSLLVSVDVKIY